ncbi:MAG TPA: nucleoside hydrolase [Acetobacteraceae bacterium]|nr:nucleoside hydrolase [Acetobacteraceae bacterium]
MTAPPPVIIDCDPGTDDAIALLLAFGSPELDVRTVTVVGGNARLACTLPNACAIVGLAGASVPVVAGADRALLGTYGNTAHAMGENGLGGITLPPGPAPAPGVAADAIRGVLRAAEQPVTLVGLGPATNLALALLTEPALVPKIRRIVLMAGAWGEGNATPAAEFNALCDPEALGALVACGAPLVLATLDLTRQALATEARVARMRAAGSGRAVQIAADIVASVPQFPRYGGDGWPLHDPCAVAWLIRPELFTTRPVRLEVDCGTGPSRGRTNIDRWCDRAVANATVLETVDAEGLFGLIGERLGRLGAASSVLAHT